MNAQRAPALAFVIVPLALACATPRAAVVKPDVPPALAVPAGNVPALALQARGVQMYDCVADAAGALSWKLHAPRADLMDDAGAQVGVHYGGVDKGLPGGPYWESTRDGSRVHGGSPESVPNPGSIALLRLAALDTSGAGVFAKVSFIQRLGTTGGAAPAGGCASAGQKTEVPYTATYQFFVPQPP